MPDERLTPEERELPDQLSHLRTITPSLYLIEAERKAKAEINRIHMQIRRAGSWT